MKTDLERKNQKEPFILYGAGVLLVVLGFVLAYQFVEPAPPDSIRIATGNPQNAYYRFAKEYQQALAAQGVRLEVISTAGSVENLQRLETGDVDIAFVQGGIEANPDSGLEALGSLYFEPLWLFHRNDIDIQRLTDLKQKRLAVGAGGSGTQSVVRQLLLDNGINSSNSELLPLADEEAVDALNNGEIDAVFFVTSPRSPLVNQLLKTTSVTLFSFDRAEGYQRLHRFLSSVTVPTGVIDMEHNIPDKTITLLAPAATLVVNREFHPALAVLMLEAATQSHGKGGLFEEPNQFPSREWVDYPLHEDAERFLKSGPPLLMRFLPFWAANLVDRLMVMLIPLITLMIPLAKVLPPTYRWRVRSRIYRWYDQLRDLDFKAESVTTGEQAQRLLDQLVEVEKDVMQVPVPKSYADTQYNLRLHFRLIRERLERKLKQLKQ